MTAKKRKSLIRLDKLAIIIGFVNLFVITLIFKNNPNGDAKYLLSGITIITLGFILSSFKDITRTKKIKIHR